MAIFGRRDNTPVPPVQSKQSIESHAGKTTKAAKRTNQSTETTIIANGTKIEGVFDTNTKLHIDGDVTGQIFSNNVVTIGSKGHVKAEMKSDKMLISGVFEGNADCNIIEILTGGRFIGKALTKELIIETKAHFEGESKIKKDNENLVLVEKKPVRTPEKK